MIKIVTDSTGCVPPEIVRQYDIRVVPLNVHFGNERVFRDGVDLDSASFFKMLAEAPELPRTSQPSPGQFREVFAELTRNGDAVLCIVISSGLSGTYQSAMDARHMLPEAQIEVIDSQYVAGALAMLVHTAAQLAAEGRPMHEIVACVEYLKQHMHLYFVVDTLEYLHKGGRVGAAATLLGTLLKVKPILSIDQGIIKPLDRVRSKRKAVQRMLAEFEAQAEPGLPLQGMVMHALVPEEASELEAELQRRLPCQRIIRPEVSAVIGVYTGPGVLGAAICPLACPAAFHSRA